jgi:hypothetical protein
MNELMNELKNAGLTAELTHTGGGVMVAFIDVNDKTIGVDEYSVCLYDSEMNEERVIFTLDDSLDYGDSLKTLANMARIEFEKWVN